MASNSCSFSDNNVASSTSRFVTPESIAEALGSMREAKGSSLLSLKRFFRANVPDGLKDADLKRQIKAAVDKGLAEGQFVQKGRKLALDLPEEETGSKKRRRKAVDEDGSLRGRRRRRASRSRRGRTSRRGRSRRRRRRRRGLSRRRRRSGSRRRRRSSRHGRHRRGRRGRRVHRRRRSRLGRSRRRRR